MTMIIFSLKGKSTQKWVDLTASIPHMHQHAVFKLLGLHRIYIPFKKLFVLILFHDI